MSVIKGENAILYWKVDGFYRPIACMESCNVTTNTELSETSTVQTGIYRTYRGNRNTWTVSAQGLCSFDTNHPHVKLRLLQQSMTAVPISFTATDDNDITETFSGNVLITTLPTDSAAGDFYTYSIEAVGTGEYIISDIPIDPNECCQDAWEYYTANGTENFSITLAGLKGRTIAGRLYRDGIEYRPSGVDHDGTGIPAGKQFKFEIAIGKISFDSNIIPLAFGEQVDIPFNFCGGGSLTCGIVIDEVNAEPDITDGNKFHITFVPTIDNMPIAPDDVKVRYSTDDGATWLIPDSITYMPEMDYQLVIINDALAIDEDYLFEVTPVCNEMDGQPGTGFYNAATCVNVTNLAAEKNGTDVDFSFNASVSSTTNYTVKLVNSDNEVVDEQTISGVSGTFEDVPDIDTEEYRVFVYTNCENGLQSSGVSAKLDNTYQVTYTNNQVITVKVYIGNNNSAPSTTLVDEVYPGGSGIHGASVDLPAVDANVVLDLSGTGKTIISANCNGVPGPTGGSTSTWSGVNGRIVISFITT